MTNAALTQERLRGLPPQERAEALEDLALTEFRRVLLMEEDEELSVDVSFFDLGLTSLRLMDVKQSLERELGLDIDATALFNQPTIEQLVAYLDNALEVSA
ncbi:acyl carrier protein [Streptomyces durbertensis]|uniref:Acyl carrier protein n=1 Tax=Streptomyces durbertensis TaxID=2448886 RepID=A0ABR6EBS7_9ACTN|nr:acyl carrier protein [Streptomyces durbertensis]MBB1242430.1 acyl carrier protein [Streptomyces durbertensis]